MKPIYEEEFETIIKKIKNSEEFQKRKQYKHHDKITVYDHSLNVSKKAYRIAKIFHTDYKSAAIAGLLHDFYENPWQEDNTKRKFFQKHGFTHAKNALYNSKKHFEEYMKPKIENAILRHMFPLNIRPPKYSTGWIVTLADKIVSLEVFKHPKSWPRLVGIKIKRK